MSKKRFVWILAAAAWVVLAVVGGAGIVQRVLDGHRLAAYSSYVPWAARGRGLVPNPAMAVDRYLKDVCLTDPIAGDSAFGGTRVRLTKGAAAAGAAATPMPRAGYYSEGPRMVREPAADPETRAWLAGYAETPRTRGATDASVSAEAAWRWRREGSA